MNIYTEYLEARKAKAAQFIDKLVAAGVPREQIHTNDFDSCPTERIYITIPYGRNNGGDSRRWQRWSDYDLQNAIRFWQRGK